MRAKRCQAAARSGRDCSCSTDAGQDAETGPSTAAATASALPAPVATSSR